MAPKETTTPLNPQTDVRLIERALRTGRLDRKEYEALLKRLPDDEGRGEYIEVYEEPAAESPEDAETLTFT
jgi:hypothetical protein